MANHCIVYVRYVSTFKCEPALGRSRLLRVAEYLTRMHCFVIALFTKYVLTIQRLRFNDFEDKKVPLASEGAQRYVEVTMDDTYELNLKNITSWVAASALIFGAVIPYVPQYKEIKRKEDAEGFSLYVCLTLLIANTLRIMFWFGKRYELPLLLQSLLMIVAMFVMIKLCINVQNRTQIIKSKERVLTDFEARYFWKWTDFKSYLGFMILFASIGGLLMYLFMDIPVFVEVIGFLAVLIEAMLGVPQFLRNSSNKSTVGMSIIMVAMWTVGDVFKTCYFVLRDTPVQFQVCGALQVTIDVAILAQVYLYKTNNNLHTRAPIRSD